MIVYELAAISAAAIAAVSIWHNFRVQRRIRAVDARIEKMQMEIDVLQTQESRRVMSALKARMESPGLRPDDNDPVDIDGDVVRLMGNPRATSMPS